MSASDRVKRAIESINRSRGVTDRGNAVREMISGVQEYVNNLEMEKNLVKEIPALQTEINDLKTQVKAEELSSERRQLERAIHEKEDVLKQALQARRNSDKNRTIIKNLRTDVSELKRLLDSAI